MDRGECRLISDACVSMRVCFDTFCFSSTQQRLADEEDVSQLANSTSATVIHPEQGGALSGTTTQAILAPQHQQTVAAMGTLRELQELLRVKDERIADLEEQLRRRDSEIQDLRSHLDKFLSVLPFKSPITPTKPRPRKQRAQGISAEPPLQVLAPLVVVDKSDRLVPRDFFSPFFLHPSIAIFRHHVILCMPHSFTIFIIFFLFFFFPPIFSIYLFTNNKILILFHISNQKHTFRILSYIILTRISATFTDLCMRYVDNMQFKA